MEKSKKRLSLALGMGMLSCAFLGLGISSLRLVAQAEEAPKENGPVEITCKNHLGEDVQITVEYRDGTYYLEDRLRNIFVQNIKGETNESAVVSNPTKYPAFTSTDGNFDGVAVSTFQNVVAAYDFYCEENIGFDWFGVNGKNDEIWDNQKSRSGEYSLYILMNTEIPGLDNNALFESVRNKNYSLIFVGNVGRGSSENFYYGAALDVIAHEYQHGVTKYLTDGLGTDGETGSINEAISDMFGSLVEAKKNNYTPKDPEFWKFGEDGSSGNDFLRDGSDPNTADKGNYKYTYDQKFECNQYGNHYYHNCDQNGTHRNCTILTYLQYKACQKTNKFTTDVMAKLWIETLKALPKDPKILDFAETYRLTAYNLNLDNDIQKAIDDALEENKFGKIHKVTFQTEDKSPIKVCFVRDKGNAVAPENPTKEISDGYRYVFKEWEGSYENITSDTTVTAKFDKIKVYHVQFFDDEDHLLKEEYVDEGTAANAPTPNKDHTDEYRFEFESWDNEYDNITQDTVIHGTYKKIRIHKVTFLDGEGKSLKEDFVDEGKAAEEPVRKPSKEKTAELRYEFDGWDQDFSNVRQELVVKPKFKEIKYYTVTFKDNEGNVLKEAQEIDEGQSASAPESPTDHRDGNKRYVFKEWSAPFDSVHENLTITPVFDEINIYKVKFVKEDGSEIQTYEVDEGGSVEIAPKAPDKSSDEQYDYTFKEWSGSYKEVKSDLTLSPVYDKTVRKYTVTYYVDGQKNSAELEYGASLESILPQGAKGWFKDSSCSTAFTGTVNGNLTVYTKSKSNLGLIIGISAAGVVVLAGAAVAVILILKKKKSANN